MGEENPEKLGVEVDNGDQGDRLVGEEVEYYYHDEEEEELSVSSDSEIEDALDWLDLKDDGEAVYEQHRRHGVR